MNLLAVETATEACSAALLFEGGLLQRHRVAPREHAHLILGMCEELLAEAGIGRGRLDAIAFGRGPGSFTGVRVATGVVQGIAFALDLPVVPVSTLAAIAQGAFRERGWGEVVAAIDARMGEVYWGAYRASDGLVAPVDGEHLSSPSAARGAFTERWHGAGSGWGSYGALLAPALKIASWDGERLPQARDVATLAAAACARGETVVAGQALPVYLRDEVAHRQRG